MKLSCYILLAERMLLCLFGFDRTTNHQSLLTNHLSRPRQLRWHSEFQGIFAPRAAAKREYHSSRLKETETALAQARNRSGREVPNTGWIFAGCLRSQASS
ncbi:MAG: hypothetical protein WAM44_12995, partial [Chthoniobacterales bacterium]